MRTFFLSSFLLWSISFTGVLHAAGIKVIMSVDWEGRELSRSNLRTMNRFRDDFPDIPIVQFLNAAYFLKPGAVAEDVRQKIDSVLRPHDEQGLHIHSWRSLVEASGITYRAAPNWDGDQPDLDCGIDCGHGVPLWAYDADEFSGIVSKATSILTDNGYAYPKSFRAGGWMAPQKVLQILAEHGIQNDSSSVPHEYLSISRAKYIQSWAAQIWPDSTETSQPYAISLNDGLSIQEFPDNGCLADYVSGDKMYDVFLKQVALWKADPSQDVVLSIGFHTETARYYMSRVRRAVRLISEHVLRENIPVEFTTLEKL